MDDRTRPTSTPATSTLTPVEPSGSRWRHWPVLLPAAAFLAGAVLSGVVVGAVAGDDEQDAAGARPTASAPPTPAAQDDDVLVRVPGPCVQLADRTEEAYALLDRGVTAARDLDARALADLVDEVQQRRPQVQALVTDCRQQAATAVVEPAPTP